ncbi:class I SAM-dependent methyltransferase, partial [bacterium]|nr:class I SAM-dependent methyltransferase [bacterium]
VFLFHELPTEVREGVIAESFRVLKSGGVLAAVDSIQQHDAPEWSSILTQFPSDFHEPFFRSYTEQPLEGLFSAAGLSAVTSRTGFVSKLVAGEKPQE